IGEEPVCLNHRRIDRDRKRAGSGQHTRQRRCLVHDDRWIRGRCRRENGRCDRSEEDDHERRRSLHLISPPGCWAMDERAAARNWREPATGTEPMPEDRSEKRWSLISAPGWTRGTRDYGCCRGKRYAVPLGSLSLLTAREP